MRVIAYFFEICLKINVSVRFSVEIRFCKSKSPPRIHMNEIFI